MDRRLLEPRWLLAHAGVVVVAVLFISLGLWQLSRLEDRRLENEIGSARIDSDPVRLGELLSSSSDLEALEYRRVIATGVYDPDHEVLIRSQVHQGTAGFHVITPLVGESGRAVLVNRGWVPLGMDEVPVRGAAPPPGEVTVEGWVGLSQQRPPLGAEHPAEGRLTTMNRVDIGRIDQQVPMPLAEVYLVRIGDRDSELPIAVSLPEFTDQGPHLAYAIQWFGFALIGLVGYVFLARRQLRSSA